MLWRLPAFSQTVFGTKTFERKIFSVNLNLHLWFLPWTKQLSHHFLHLVAGHKRGYSLCAMAINSNQFFFRSGQETIRPFIGVHEDVQILAYVYSKYNIRLHWVKDSAVTWRHPKWWFENRGIIPNTVSQVDGSENFKMDTLDIYIWKFWNIQYHILIIIKLTLLHVVNS